MSCARRQLREHLLARGARLGRVRRLCRTSQRRARRTPARLHPAQQRRRLRHARDARAASSRAGAIGSRARSWSSGNLRHASWLSAIGSSGSDSSGEVSGGADFSARSAARKWKSPERSRRSRPCRAPGRVPYRDHIMAVELADIDRRRANRNQQKLQAVVYLWSMRDNVWTSAARLRPGDKRHAAVATVGRCLRAVRTDQSQRDRRSRRCNWKSRFGANCSRRVSCTGPRSRSCNFAAPVFNRSPLLGSAL